jgi:homogentisate 1,2-dioxygenase
LSPADTNNKNRTAGGCKSASGRRKNAKHRCFEGFHVKPGGEFLQSRVPVLVNNDCHIVLAAPQSGTLDYFYKNTDADEMIFVHEGSGTVHSQYGELPFGMAIILYCPGELFIKLNSTVIKSFVHR